MQADVVMRIETTIWSWKETWTGLTGEVRRPITAIRFRIRGRMAGVDFYLYPYLSPPNLSKCHPIHLPRPLPPIGHISPLNHAGPQHDR